MKMTEKEMAKESGGILELSGHKCGVTGDKTRTDECKKMTA